MRSLFARLYATYVAGLFVALIGSGVLTYLLLGSPRAGFLDSHVKGFARQIGLSFSRGVTDDIATAIEKGDRKRLEALVRDQAGDLGVRVTVFDAQGRVYVTTARAVAAPPPALLERLVKGEVVVARHPPPVRAYAPVLRQGELYGVVGVSPRLLQPGSHLARVSVWLAAFFAALAALTYPVARGMARRIERLTGVARRIAGGDLEARAAVGGGDEIGVLGVAMNEMAGTIAGLMRGQKELVAAASHELRSPLARLKVSLEMAREAGVPEEARARHLAEVDADITDLEALVGDLLLASRLELQDFPLRPEDIDLGALARDVAARYPGVVVTCRGEGRVHADGRLIGRILTNLVDNARAAAGRAAPVEMAVLGDEAGVALEVRDHGPGVPAGERERIFEPFYRSDPSRSRDKGGAGLGLAIARRIAVRHGGTLVAGEAHGGGATFRLWLPRRAA